MSSVYSNYIKRMRMCANGNCKGCTYQYEGLTNTESCKEDLLYDAAEQLEDADKCNARLVKKCKEMEKRIAELTQTCTELTQTCTELEAQLPKEGEWIWENYYWHCSVCGENPTRGMGYVQGKNELFRVCPNCGAKMKGEHDNEQ